MEDEAAARVACNQCVSTARGTGFSLHPKRHYITPLLKNTSKMEFIKQKKETMLRSIPVKRQINSVKYYIGCSNFVSRLR